MREYDGVHEAFIGSVTDVMMGGKDITVRKMPTKELRGESFSVKYAKRRMLAIPERATNPFAQIAETLWMLSGEDNLNWLEMYIPQCKKWSDDGETWRGAYGPRLRNYKYEKLSPDRGIDQLDEVRTLLLHDPETRQAVMTIWNPELDWVKSKDIPCNNWLQFLIRDGQLHLHVAVRSNDAIYGFSHNDFFSWSVLLQMMAHWVGVRTGSISWFAGSYHIYDKMFALARKVAVSTMPSMYKFVASTKHCPIQAPEFDTEFDHFDMDLELVMETEKEVRRLVKDNELEDGRYETIAELVDGVCTRLDKFMGICLKLMCAYVLYKEGSMRQGVNMIKTTLDSDMKVAAIMWMIRNGVPYDEFTDCFSSIGVAAFVEEHYQKFQ
jgi:thymidylate synthase